MSLKSEILEQEAAASTPWPELEERIKAAKTTGELESLAEQIARERPYIGNQAGSLIDFIRSE